MKLFQNRVEDEKKTVGIMITMYCNAYHNTNNNELCNDCNSLLNYAIMRIDDCVFEVNKPTWEKCPVHCYEQDQRDNIKKIMRYSGPRMLFRHPILTIKHLIKNRSSD